MNERIIMYINVLIEYSAFNIDKYFTYHVNDEYQDLIKIGLRVRVPFNTSTVEGIIMNIVDKPNFEVKNIIDVIDSEPILNDELLELGKWLSKKTVSTLISCYQVMLPKALKMRNKNKVINIKYNNYVKLSDVSFNIDNLTDKQKDIIKEFNNYDEILYSSLKKINSSVDTLIKNNILIKYSKEEYRYHKDSDISEKIVLTEEQKNVVQSVNLNDNKTYLLYGVTGSGKTLCYMEIIEKVINSGKTALLLVPEITLTTQIQERFLKRFSKIAILHSGLSDGERYDEYRKIKNGEVNIVIGARSACFAPLNNLGVIIVDECHTDSYKQDNMPKYHAIDVLEKRKDYHNCPLILGSATPELIHFAKAQKGLYQLLLLPHRVGNSKLPKIKIVDLTKCERINKTNISKELYDEIIKKTKLGEQVILLINRRGYSSSLMCKNCGYVFKCPHCEVSYIYHKSKDNLRCHYCGRAINKPDTCPNCHNDHLSLTGSGTEKIEEELESLFPELKIVRMDLDTTSRKGSHERIIKDFADHKYDILLGTQMIAKGLDFPNVTLVGVINADTSLFIPSYKSPERTFALLSQVAGRSGRGDREGMVIIQTFNVDHYAINLACSNNYISFYNEEMKNRLVSKYPPYYYLCNLIIKSKDYDLVSNESRKIVNLLNNKLVNMEVLGPSVCSPFKVNNVCRFGILIKYKSENNLIDVLNELINHYKSNNKIIIDVDFNPNNI